jgi:hypothetical protein
MNNKRASVTLLTLSIFPLLASAATEEAHTTPSVLVGLFWTIVPIVLAGVLVWWFLTRVVRKQATRADNYIADQKQHHERVEQLLERIARAVERKETDVH